MSNSLSSNLEMFTAYIIEDFDYEYQCYVTIGFSLDPYVNPHDLPTGIGYQSGYETPRVREIKIPASMVSKLKE